MSILTPSFWNEKKVFVTGHTGFKGAWLSLWLNSMGAEVHGYALTPPTTPNLFDVAGIAKLITSNIIADIRDYDSLRATLKITRPEIIFHLAAQPLVRESYKLPVETYAVNVMGVVHLLEAVRHTDSVKAVVNITSDKCYENKEWHRPYRENDPMGGHDPYSSSKGCVELVSAAYKRSFLEPQGVHVATARAGNVIGGGDFSKDRLLPDILRSMDSGEILKIRYPSAIRPWQHVLEPLSGYLMLAELLYTEGEAFAEPWNFGPLDGDARSVGWILEYIASKAKGFKWQCEEQPQPHEATLLKLDSSKARERLGWRPCWNIEQALDHTMAWHEAWRGAQNIRDLMAGQISQHVHVMTTENNT
ncbi:MAG: CDP-glucose 4,6-dehydratase [Deltaproteobacteria bacterium]|nr:CDP-glucose 4,6-dehydratase [Deltaproteobacteria bacterium]